MMPITNLDTRDCPPQFLAEIDWRGCTWWAARHYAVNLSAVADPGGEADRMGEKALAQESVKSLWDRCLSAIVANPQRYERAGDFAPMNGGVYAAVTEGLCTSGRSGSSRFIVLDHAADRLLDYQQLNVDAEYSLWADALVDDYPLRPRGLVAVMGPGLGGGEPGENALPMAFAVPVLLPIENDGTVNDYYAEALAAARAAGY